MITLYELYKTTKDAKILVQDEFFPAREYHGEEWGMTNEVVAVKPNIDSVGDSYTLEVEVKLHNENIIQFTAKEIDRILDMSHRHVKDVYYDIEDIKIDRDPSKKADIKREFLFRQLGADSMFWNIKQEFYAHRECAEEVTE